MVTIIMLSLTEVFDCCWFELVVVDKEPDVDTRNRRVLLLQFMPKILVCSSPECSRSLHNYLTFTQQRAYLNVS